MYPVMGEPPSLSGSAQVSSTCEVDQSVASGAPGLPGITAGGNENNQMSLPNVAELIRVGYVPLNADRNWGAGERIDSILACRYRFFYSNSNNHF